MAISKRPNSVIWNKTAKTYLGEDYEGFVKECEKMDQRHRASHPEKTENQLYIHASAEARDLAHTWLAKKLYVKLDSCLTAEELLTRFKEEYKCNTVLLSTMRKAINEVNREARAETKKPKKKEK